MKPFHCIVHFYEQVFGYSGDLMDFDKIAGAKIGGRCN